MDTEATRESTTGSKLDAQRISEFVKNTNWYHTIDLGSGLKSSGLYDHNSLLAKYGFPESLSGKTVLDVGSSDGFFSFEFERRGGQVTAVDNNPYDGNVTTDVSPAKIDSYQDKYKNFNQKNAAYSDVYRSLGVPVGHQLLAAIALKKSKVQHQKLNIYDLHTLGKKYDFVFCGDLVEHLKNPLEALENLASVTKGQCILAHSNEKRLGRYNRSMYQVLRKALRLPVIDPSHGVEYVGNKSGGAFFYFYPETLKNALLASGFKKVEIYSQFELFNRRHGIDVFHTVYHCSM
ncbi:MAG: methyltransferase domain-containing protein [Bdellovibrionota bacterium]